MPNKIIIIAAGGSGSRLQSDLPKQYLPLKGIPVLMHTINAFVGIADRIIVVLNENMIETWQTLCSDHQFEIDHELIVGGQTRFQSVRNAVRHIAKTIDQVGDSPIAVGIHDAARPLVDRKLILESLDMALSGQSNVLAVPSINSIRIGDKLDSKSIDRNLVWQVQTPQSFPASLLIKAYNQVEVPTFTDDASVVEQMGIAIRLIESTARNIKITFADDFKIAMLYMQSED